MRRFINYIKHKLAKFVYPEIDKIMYKEYNNYFLLNSSAKK